ncbi:MAG: pantetheine-phosphate adenylyltransferase [Candidatus Hodarchaeota archaeon]
MMKETSSERRWIVGLGGTFDHLHEGHEKLLTTAFNLGKKVLVGLATDELLKNKKLKELIQDYETRKNNLVEFAESIGRGEDLVIIPLDDPFGPAVTEPSLEMHISSEETIEVAIKMNEARVKNGLNPLILVTIPMVLDRSGERYSSTRIREELDSNF